jgi:diacylglycerol kinase (ATP)
MAKKPIKKANMVAFASQHQAGLANYRLIATGPTGQRIQSATGLAIECKRSARRRRPDFGGNWAGQVVAVIFLLDPLYAPPHEPDIQALLRICEVHNVPLAINLATAAAIVNLLAAP